VAAGDSAPDGHARSRGVGKGGSHMVSTWSYRPSSVGMVPVRLWMGRNLPPRAPPSASSPVRKATNPVGALPTHPLDRMFGFRRTLCVCRRIKGRQERRDAHSIFMLVSVASSVGRVPVKLPPKDLRRGHRRRRHSASPFATAAAATAASRQHRPQRNTGGEARRTYRYCNPSTLPSSVGMVPVMAPLAELPPTGKQTPVVSTRVGLAHRS
jgi:hypothetical protein